MSEKYIKASDCEKYFYEHLDDVHIAAAMNAIDEMPAADVAPVVRCKDCVLHGHCSTEDVFLFSRLKSENAFCCVGKRKEDNNENAD